MAIFNELSSAYYSVAQHLSFLLPDQVTLTFFLLLFSGLCAILIYSLLRKNQELQHHNSQLRSMYVDNYHFLEDVVQQSPYQWLLWDQDQSVVHYGTKIAQLFNLSLLKSSFADFLHHLDDGSALYVRNTLSDLSNASRFEATAILKSSNQRITILAEASDAYSGQRMLWLKIDTDDADCIETMSFQILKQMLEALPFPVWRKNSQGLLSYCNAAYAEVMDATVQEVLTNQLPIWADKTSLSQQHGSMSIKHPDHVVLHGRRIPVDFREHDMQSSQGKLGYVLDLTEAEIAQKNLNLHIVAHQELLERLSCGVSIYYADQRLHFFNHAYARMFDLDENWLQTKPSFSSVLEHLHKRNLLPEQSNFPAFKKRSMSMFTSLITPLQELSHLPDERTLRLVTSPYPMGGLFFLFEDVTDSLILERRTNTQLEVFKDSIANLEESIAIINPNNTLKVSNPAFAKTWQLCDSILYEGTHINEFLEKSKEYFHTKATWKYHYDIIIECLNDRSQKSARLNRKDGSILEFVYVPLSDGSHLLQYLDISDSTRIEALLREKNEALASAQKIKTDFLSYISQTFKAPLNTILGFGEMLSNQCIGELSNEQSAYCRGIIQASHHQLIMLNDVIDLSTMRAGLMGLNLQSFDLLHMLSAMIASTDALRDCQVDVRCDAAVSGVTADERRLKQALCTLVQYVAHQNNLSVSQICIWYEEQYLVLEIGSVIQCDAADQSIAPDAACGKFRESDFVENVALALAEGIFNLHGGKLGIVIGGAAGSVVKCFLPLELQPIPQQELFHAL